MLTRRAKAWYVFGALSEVSPSELSPAEVEKMFDVLELGNEESILRKLNEWWPDKGERFFRE